MPGADLLYACDGAWWRARGGVPEFRGVRLCQDAAACTMFPDVHKVEVCATSNNLLVERPGQIGGGGNSGFQALNIAAQFGAARIVLVGFDMRLDRGPHWHGRHPAGLNNPSEANMVRWRRALNGAADTLRRLGITVVNASPVSTLTAYPIVPIEEALHA